MQVTHSTFPAACRLAAALSLIALLIATLATHACGQPAEAEEAGDAGPGPVQQDDVQGDDELIELNLPEGMPLQLLVDYVGERLELNLIYDPATVNQRVTLKAPARVPKSSLLGLLRSVLKMKGMALVEADQPGWWRIVQVQDLTDLAGPPPADPDDPEDPEDPQPREAADPTQAVTRIFRIEHARLSEVQSALQPFLSGRGANLLPVTERSLLIVTDYAANMDRIRAMVELLDSPLPERRMAFVPVEHLEAQALAERVRSLLSAMHEGRRGAAQLQLQSDGRANQLVLIGPEAAVAEAKRIIEQLDVSLDLQTRVYEMTYVEPERLDELATKLIGPLAVQTRYQAATDAEAGLLIVTAPPAIHAQVAALAEDLDVPTPTGRSPVRFYPLANRTAGEVLGVIESIRGGQPLAAVDLEGQGEVADGRTPADADERPHRRPGAETARGVTTVEELAAGAEAAQLDAGLRRGLQTAEARVTADEQTNTIIVVADPATHRVYQQLIERLDQRRPQVLIEVTLVTLDVSDGYSLGVEVSQSADVDDGRLLSFSSFGLSEVDPTTGELSLNPGLGFNGALLGSDVAEVVLRALKDDARARVVSAPRILINDHASGTLSSVNEAPFSSVNASDTVATTSFAGFAEAGTTITLTPHISDDGYIQLDYQLTLSSFSGSASNDLPPPRQTNNIASQATVPEGSMVVVGGLQRHDRSLTKRGIPILGDIPILEYAFSNRSVNDANTALFVFIRPVVLADADFADLKYLSRQSLEAAELPPNLPASEPLLVY